MNHVTPDEISRAREMDLLTYLRCYEPQELVKASCGEYSTRSHDSVKISNGKWYRFATNEGGRSALDYLIKVEGIPFIQAVQRINGQVVNTLPASFHKQKQPKQENRKLLLPPRADSNAKAIAYLISRGVDREIIDMNTYNQSMGMRGSYSKNWQLQGRELMMPDEVRMLDNRYALLFIRGERPVKNLKFDILRHPNVKLTTDGGSEDYRHGEDTISKAVIEVLHIDPKSLPDTEEDAGGYTLISDEELEETFSEKKKGGFHLEDDYKGNCE